jgi:hypothetical protein
MAMLFVANGRLYFQLVYDYKLRFNKEPFP